LFHQFYAAYAATYVFLILLAAYDLWSTRRIQRAMIWGSAFLILMGQMTRLPSHTGCRAGHMSSVFSGNSERIPLIDDTGKKMGAP